jgi:hypothetical protein
MVPLKGRQTRAVKAWRRVDESAGTSWQALANSFPGRSNAPLP